MGSIGALVEWPEEISREVLTEINLLRKKIEKEMKEVVIDIVPAYNSLSIFFNTSKIRYSSVIKKIEAIYSNEKDDIKPESRLWRIPVCYDKQFGIDLDELARHKGISVGEVVKLHVSVIYDVYFIGFLPGFIYLGGLPGRIHHPRKSKPRQKVLRGSVGIADAQTGIYAMESPGGWNIIGNSPFNFFSVHEDPPAFATSGDKLLFYEIDIQEHKKIRKAVEMGSFKLENEIYG